MPKRYAFRKKRCHKSIEKVIKIVHKITKISVQNNGLHNAIILIEKANKKERERKRRVGDMFGKRRQSKRFMPYLFLAPVLLLLGIFKYVPFGMAVQKSFYNWNGSTLNEFVGLANYKEAFSDAIFQQSILKAFIVMGVQVLIVVTVPLLTAELLFAVRSLKKQYVIRTLLTVPMVVPTVVVILLWKWLLGGDTGLINLLLNQIGLENMTAPWLGDSQTALGAILAIGFPWLGIVSLGGMPFLIYFGGLQSISSDLYEAAKLDGVSIFQRVRKIDLPMLAGQIKLMVTLVMINSLQIFDAVFITTKGGPGTSSMVPAVYMYEQGFSYRRMGYCSALGIILFVMILALTAFNNKVIKGSDN